MSSLPDIQTLIHEKFGLDPASLDPHASMRDKGVDSLSLIELLFAIEDRFGIALSDKDSNVDTLAELAAVVDRARTTQTA